jgi:hypothetical protein
MPKSNNGRDALRNVSAQLIAYAASEKEIFCDTDNVFNALKRVLENNFLLRSSAA